MLDPFKALRKVAFISGIGVAGLLAYRVYASYTTPESSWRVWWLPQSCSFLPSSWVQYFTSTRSLDGVDKEEEARQAESDLIWQYYEQTVRGSNAFHEELLESIGSKILQGDGLEDMLRIAAECEASESHFARMKVASFTRFIMAMWTVPASFLLSRMVFCVFGRILYLSTAAEAIHTSRRQNYQEAEQSPPCFDRSYQRRVLRTFKSIVPETISRYLYRLISQVVAEQVEQIPADELMSLQAMNVLLSTINSETENRIAAQNGKFWESLLGDRTLLRALGLESYDDENDAGAFIRDVLREARNVVTTRPWHVVMVDTVKVFVQTQGAFMREAYNSVLEQTQQQEHEEQLEEQDSIDGDDSCDEENTDVIESESSAFHITGRDDEETVVYDDDESETSDKSAYDISHTPSIYYGMQQNTRHATPDPSAVSIPDRARIVAEGSLEPLGFSDSEEPPMEGAEMSAFYYDGDDTKGQKWEGGGNESELDTGDHHSFVQSPVPPAKRHSVLSSPLVRAPSRVPAKPSKPPQAEEVAPKDGIVFFRWATKLGKRGKDLLSEASDSARELGSIVVVNDFGLNVFAPDAALTLPRCHLESDPVLPGRS